jgi:acetyltransferase-like isoleucine patch superfamily enzyme
MINLELNDVMMGGKEKQKLKFCGQGVKIYPLSKIINPSVIEIGDFSMIDDFTFVNGGAGIQIGRYVHIASFVGIIGGGELIIGDYVSISIGSKILTGTDTYHDGKRMSTALPEEQRNILRGKVVIKRDAFLGANTVIHPNVIIGEGAIVGSNSLVLKDVEPWSINIGSPCKKIGLRPKIVVGDI